MNKKLFKKYSERYFEIDFNLNNEDLFRRYFEYYENWPFGEYAKRMGVNLYVQQDAGPLGNTFRLDNAFLKEIEFTSKVTGVSYRVLNSWEKKGLFDNYRNDVEWRKFTFPEIVWINTVRRLRKFGYPLGKIKILKDCLCYLNNEVNAFMPFLELYIMICLAEKKIVLLVVFEDGIGFVMDNDEYKNTMNDETVRPHIYIRLDAFIKELYEQYLSKEHEEKDEEEDEHFPF